MSKHKKIQANKYLFVVTLFLVSSLNLLAQKSRPNIIFAGTK